MGTQFIQSIGIGSCAALADFVLSNRAVMNVTAPLMPVGMTTIRSAHQGDPANAGLVAFSNGAIGYWLFRMVKKPLFGIR